MCPPPNSHVEVLSPTVQNVLLLEHREFERIIKVK